MSACSFFLRARLSARSGAKRFHHRWPLIVALVLLLVSLPPLLPACSITSRKVTVVCCVQRESLTSLNRPVPREQRNGSWSPLPFPGVPLRRRHEAEHRGSSGARGEFPASPRRRQPLRGKLLQR